MNKIESIIKKLILELFNYKKHWGILKLNIAELLNIVLDVV